MIIPKRKFHLPTIDFQEPILVSGSNGSTNRKNSPFPWCHFFPVNLVDIATNFLNASWKTEPRREKCTTRRGGFRGHLFYQPNQCTIIFWWFHQDDHINIYIYISIVWSPPKIVNSYIEPWLFPRPKKMFVTAGMFAQNWKWRGINIYKTIYTYIIYQKLNINIERIYINNPGNKRWNPKMDQNGWIVKEFDFPRGPFSGHTLVQSGGVIWGNLATWNILKKRISWLPSL